VRGSGLSIGCNHLTGMHLSMRIPTSPTRGEVAANPSGRRMDHTRAAFASRIPCQTFIWRQSGVSASDAEFAQGVHHAIGDAGRAPIAAGFARSPWRQRIGLARSGIRRS